MMDDLYARLSKLSDCRMPGRAVAGLVLRNAKEMLGDRGYEVGQVSVSSAPVDPVMVGERDGAEVRVFLDADDKVSVKTLRGLRGLRGCCVVISTGGPTPFARREAAEQALPVEWLTVKQLLLPVPRHALVPRHRRLSDDEAAAVCKRVAALPEQLPVLRTSDPVCRWYAFPTGSVIEITRTGLGAGVFYRRVCDVNGT